MSGDSPARAWIGPAPSLTQQACIYAVGVMGIMFAGAGPLLLGGLEAAGRLSAAQLGQAGTAELLTMGLAAALAGPLLGHRRLRLIAVVCGLAMAALNLATTQVSGDLLTALRAVNGVPSGVLIWLTTGMIVRSPRPERGSGVYLTVQTLAQLIVVAGVTAFVLKPFGVDGGFVLMALLSLAAAAAGLAVPSEYAPLVEHDQGPGGLPPARGWLALAANFGFLAFILGVWIYAEPLSRQAGHVPAVAGAAFSISLAAQVAGGAAATALAGRISWFNALFVSILLMIGTLVVFGLRPAPPLFLAAAGVFGFLWLFASPFMTPLAIEADPSRRAAMLGPGSGLLGCSAGPFLASFVVSDHDVRGAVWLGVGIALATLTLIVGLHLTRARGVLQAD